MLNHGGHLYPEPADVISAYRAALEDHATFLATIASDPAAGTAGLRTLGTGATEAMPGNLAAPLDSPAFTGNPTAPTPIVGDNDTSVATTAFVQAALANAQSAAAAYRFLARYATFLAAGANFSTPVFVTSGSGGGTTASGATTANPVDLIRIIATELAVIGLTTKLNLRLVVARNSIATTATITAKLYPVTFGGSAGALSYTLGTPVTGSTVTVTPATNDQATGTSGDFTLPADGIYLPGLTTSAATEANSATDVTTQLRVHNV